jgi:6-phosphogluconolactonase
VTTTTIVYPDSATVAETTAARLLVAIADANSARGGAHVALTGGTVGIATLARAAASPLADVINWRGVHIWWGDERFLPPGNLDRNEVQAQRSLLKRLRLPEENIHRMASSESVNSPEKAAQAYATELARFGDPAPAFDVLLLGLGPDGHVASLFPRRPELKVEGMSVVAVKDSPKPPPTRISLTLPTINGAREVWIITSGSEKAHAVAESISHKAGIPGGMVRGTDRTLWLIDAAAAAEIEPQRTSLRA